MGNENKQLTSTQSFMMFKSSPDGKLTPVEQLFIKNFIETGNRTESVKRIPGSYHYSSARYAEIGKMILERPQVQEEIKRIMDEVKKESIATADEVMGFFTAVMRGEVQDQFGLDAPLSERTRAAQEIAKRTVDIENRKAGEPDQVIAIKLDWTRDKKQNTEE